MKEVWQLTIEVPGEIDRGKIDMLFDDVVNLAGDWEDDFLDRDWDIAAYAHKVEVDDAPLNCPAG